MNKKDESSNECRSFVSCDIPFEQVREICDELSNIMMASYNTHKSNDSIKWDTLNDSITK